MTKNELLPNDEAVKDLLIILALKNDVEPKAIEISAKTIRNKFTMKLIKGK